MKTTTWHFYIYPVVTNFFVRRSIKELLDIIDRKDAEGMKTYLNKIRNNVKRDIDLLK